MRTLVSLQCFSRLTLATALAFFAAGASAQEDRITSRIDTSRRVTLKGHLHPSARAEDDRGLADGSLEIAYATLYLKPSAAQQAALEKLLIEQQDPLSANYHRWLTPEEYGDRFGLSRGDIGKITGWLESQGLKINDVARGRHWITFTGSAASVGRGFHTEIHLYVIDGEGHFANATLPSVPEALAEVVAGVGGLDNWYAAAPGKTARMVHPEVTSNSGVHYVGPDDIATIYDLKPLYAAGIDGSGQTIAIIGHYDIDLTNVNSYRTRFNLPTSQIKMMMFGPDPGSGTGDEPYLDLELAGAVARNATLVFAYAKSAGTAVQYVVDQRLATVISESIITCEPSTTTAQRAIAQQANAEGITWIAASGDVGAAGCETQGKLPQASKGLAVGSPASIPEVTAVGGTEFDDASGTYWNATNNSNLASAISYIPEKAWNDSVANSELAASTGGASMFYSKPWWQSGPGVPDDGARDVPDVSMNASWSHDGYYIYLGSWYQQGGTSASTPVFAGIVALLNHYLVTHGVLSQPGLGNINPTLYRLAQSAPGAFHDIVKGDNIVPCMQGSPNCVNGFLGYTAGPGYDQVTGLGSIDGYQLATSWTIGTPTSTTVSASPATIAFNSVKLTASVTASGGVASGDVSFLLNDTALCTATLSGTPLSATLSASLPVGTNTITAVYGGSNGLNASAGITTVTVTAPANTAAIVPSVSPNPVYEENPNSNGDKWYFTVRVANQSAVTATLTKFTIGSTDYSSSINSFFGTANIAGNASISASLRQRNLNVPLDQLFGFAGTDASGATWSQQIMVPFVSRVLQDASLLLTTPATVSPVAGAAASCRWPQQLVLEQQGGYNIRLSALTSGSMDFTSQLQQIFGTTTLAPYGTLQGTLCWSSATPAGSKTVTVTGLVTESQSGVTTDATATATLGTSTATGIAPSVFPASVNLVGDSSQKVSATVSLSFSSGSPQWTAKVSPSNCLTGWLTVSPASGTGAAKLTLSASSAGLSNGVYKATVLIQSTTTQPQFFSVPVSLMVGGSLDISIGGVTNAASYQPGFAPGMLMTAFGVNLAPGPQHAASVPLPSSMQGITATVNGVSAPLLDVSPGQLSIQIPYETGAGTAFLGVNNNGKVASFPFQVAPSAPGIFMTLDGAKNLVPSASGTQGQTLTAFITGEGDVAPILMTGFAPTTADMTKLPAPGLPVTLTVGGIPAVINFIGIPRGLVGVTQVNFTIPPKAPVGPQPLVVTVGDVASPPVTLTITQ